MRILFFLLLIFLLTQPALSQQPTKKEMQAQMMEAVSELKNQIADQEKDIATAKANKEDDDTIKEMENELALLKKKLALIEGVNKNLSGVSAKTFQQAEDKGNSIIPKKDVARINALPKKILSDAELVLFVKNVKAEVEKKLPTADKTKAEELYNEIKTKYNSPTALGNVASACWMNGYPGMALYIMGKVCVSDMSNGNNLNNYAAFLTMAGGQHAALPILQNLNLKYPENSTILNNMGQAWYGLGEMDNAKKYLDNTMHLYNTHSQANLTNAEIQESEGNTEEAIASVKRSIQENYTPEKEARLNELGGKLQYEDIPWKYPGPAEPLGFEKFIAAIPEYPMEGGMTAEKNKWEWYDFHERVVNASRILGDKIAELKIKADAYNKRLLADPTILKPYNTAPYKTSNRKMALLIEWGSDRFAALDKKLREAQDSVEKWKAEFYKAKENVEDCGARKGLATAFLIKANTLWHQRNSEWLSFLKQYESASASYWLYSTSDRSVYELGIASLKKGFLDYLIGLHCEFEVGCIKVEPEKSPGKALPDYDEINCQYKSELYIPPFTTIKIECNKMETEFKISPNFNYTEGISPYVEFKWEENLNTDKIIEITKATIEVGGEVGADELKVGPLKAEAKAEVGVGIEISEHGVEEVYVKAESRVDIGGNTEHLSNYAKGAGAETIVSWNAGSNGEGGTINSSLSGVGILSGMSIGSH